MIPDITAVFIMHSYTADAAKELTKTLSEIICRQFIIVDTSFEGGFKEINSTLKDNEYQVDCLHIKEGTKGKACNEALSLALGKYIIFLNQGDTIEPSTFNNIVELYNHNNSIDAIAFPVKYIQNPERRYPLNFRFSRTRIIDLDKQNNFIHKNLKGICFRTDAIKKYKFNENLSYIDDIGLITDLLLEKGTYGALPEDLALYWSGEIVSDLEEKRYPIEWFEEVLETATSKLISDTSSYKQELLRSILSDISRFGDINDTYFVGADSAVIMKKLWQYIETILKSIPDEKLLKTRSINNSYMHSLLKTKYGESNPKSVLDDNIQKTALISAIEFKGNSVYISGHFSTPGNDPCLIVKYSSGQVEGLLQPYTKFEKYILGKKVLNAYSFEADIPLTVFKANYITFFYKEGSQSFYQMPIRHTYKSPLSFFSNMYSFNDNWIIHMQESAAIEVNRFSKYRLYERERSLASEISEKYPDRSEEVLFLRSLYLSQYKELRNGKIWLFTDSPNRGEDNAEALFNYALQLDDGIEKYFVLSDNSSDYSRIHTYAKENLLSYGSHKHLLYLFSCQRLISSHLQYSKTECEEFKFYRGFMNTSQSFIQHGIIINGIYDIFDNHWMRFNFFLTSANAERDFIVQNGHGMTEEVVQLTGMPRYDHLTSSSSLNKKILVAFTWHKNNVLRRSADGIREYNPNFIYSQYYKNIQSLITNKLLNDKASELGYEILVKLHPFISQQSKDFNAEKPVRIVDAFYRDLLNECSLMVTDYSSVALDFAYMEKPIVYCQTTPNHYPLGYFDYEQHGFGEVTFNLDDTVSTIISYMENNCEIKDIYRQRIKSFYQYKDRNNCKRTYEALNKIDL